MLGFMAFGIVNAIGECIAFLMNTALLLWFTNPVANDANLLALPITFAVLLLGHTISTVIMASKIQFEVTPKTF